MTEALGKITKPSADKFLEGRKLYCIPLLINIKDTPSEYQEKYGLYWNQVAKHINALEKAGKVSKIYHEAVSSSGQEGLEAIKQLNEKSYQLAKSKTEQGAKLEALEDKELLTNTQTGSWLCRW